ncbi:Integrase [Nitrosospira sp. Nsp14]|uniref:tyrosine-type recombinase/integrase n=1 Tax=Nitrosospira sp. Nsp14 TaxID=1855333 RepID=UPI0008EED852|nr:site-specific integrase [Nitrosospira sp. Nsp14]SFH60620.1 Integrase [Nitrosospira sp. Nsp14]
MARKAKELSALEVGRLTVPGLRFVGGVAGLALQVTPSGARSWILRVMIGGKRRDMGLGGFPDVTLAGAKEAARGARLKIKEGVDPIGDAKARRSTLSAARAASMTFSQAATAYIAVMESEWSNDKHASQWRNTLSSYAFPVIGNIYVREIDHSHVMRVLEPIWLTKTETAKRLRGRIENVLDWARVRGYRTGENPARWRGHLDMLLPTPGKVQKTKHHPALPFNELGKFMTKLQQQEGIGARGLEFAILTAARSGEVRGALWSEIDLHDATWTIPAGRMKAKREHRVALNKEAVALLQSLPRTHELIFPSSKGMKLSDMTLTAVLRRMGRGDITAHGFRSTFRDWCSERTNYARDVAEMALAHTIGDKVEAAYRRGDLFEKRRLMMRDWGKFSRQVQIAADVVPINKERALP